MSINLRALSRKIKTATSKFLWFCLLWIFTGNTIFCFAAEKKKEAVVQISAPNDPLEGSEDLLSHQLIQNDADYLRRKAFIQELSERATALRLNLAQIVAEDEQKKVIDHYRQDTAKRIQDFLASEKTMTTKPADSKTA